LSQRAGARSLDELGRRDLGVGVLGNPRELVPVKTTVEPDAEPSPVPDVGRHEELLGIRLRQQLLHAVRRRAPDREAPVPVVVRQHHQEGPLLPDEERRRAVAEPLARLRQRQADSADAFENFVSHQGNPPCAANQNTVSSSAAKTTLKTRPNRRTERGW
jgi:hypothetical protein